jgi:magnesium transporter
MMSLQGKNDDIDAEQVSILFFENMIITFQERTGDVFSPLRERIKTAKGRIRTVGADYLLYCLLDSIVDNYFVILEKMGEGIDYLEEGLVSGADSKKLLIIHGMKRDMIFMRKAVWPLREVVNSLIKGEIFIKRSTEVYLRDVYDHTIQVIDSIESLRDMASGLLDIYMTSLGNRMNEIMKVLTVLASIFIPLTFIAGVYGMNFEYMPELKWKFGYFAALGLMGAIALLMVIFFKKKKWL